MKILFIGATGYVGLPVARHLVLKGHEVTGLARSDAAAEKLARAGIAAFRGTLDDMDAVAGRALAADATVFAPQLDQESEYSAVDALLRSLKGSGKAFVFTSGTGVLGQRADGEWIEDSFAEDDAFIPSKYVLRRRHTEIRVQTAAQDGVRTMIVRPPLIWTDRHHPTVARVLASIGRTGLACYLGRGLTAKTDVHIDDLAELFALVLERGAGGAVYHAAGGELNARTITELVAARMGVKTRSISVGEAFDIWGRSVTLITQVVSSRSRSPRSRGELGWRPRHLDVAQRIMDGALLEEQPS